MGQISLNRHDGPFERYLTLIEMHIREEYMYFIITYESLRLMLSHLSVKYCKINILVIDHRQIKQKIDFTR